MARPKHKITGPERAAISQALLQGSGRALARESVGITRRVFAARMVDDPDFRDAVLEAETIRTEGRMKRIYDLSNSADLALSLKATVAYLNRVDHLDHLRLLRRDRRMLGKMSVKAGSSVASSIIPKLIGIITDLVPVDKHEEMLRRLESAADEIDGVGQLGVERATHL